MKIAIVGDYDGRPSHVATNEAIRHASSVLPYELETCWLATSQFENEKRLNDLEHYDGIWGSAGDPDSRLGLIRAIEFARLGTIPYLGTCSGFQHALVEYAMNALKPNSVGNQCDPDALFSELITEMSCSLTAESQDIVIKAESQLHDIYKTTTILERYNCAYALNNTYREAFEQSDLKFVAHNQQGDVRVVELHGHPFFLAMLFQPQLSSAELHPHPIIVAFLDAANSRACQRTGTT